MTWWDTEHWHAYEVAYGDAPGTRARLLASADWQTHVIDLTPDEATLWRGIRKSYKSLIHRAERRFEWGMLDLRADTQTRGIDVLSGQGASGLISACQRVHAAESGRVTRPARTWELMGEWAEAGHGLIAVACDYRHARAVMEGDDAPAYWPPCVAFAYFAVWDGWAYYFSSATLQPNVHHALIWTAMNALKARGVQQLEMGWQGQATDPKGQQIEFFRRGFGGHAQEVGAQWPTTSANTTSANT